MRKHDISHMKKQEPSDDSGYSDGYDDGFDSDTERQRKVKSKPIMKQNPKLAAHPPSFNSI